MPIPPILWDVMWNRQNYQTNGEFPSSALSFCARMKNFLWPFFKKDRRNHCWHSLSTQTSSFSGRFWSFIDAVPERVFHSVGSSSAKIARVGTAFHRNTLWKSPTAIHFWQLHRSTKSSSNDRALEVFEEQEKPIWTSKKNTTPLEHPSSWGLVWSWSLEQRWKTDKTCGKKFFSMKF